MDGHRLGVHDVAHDCGHKRARLSERQAVGQRVDHVAGHHVVGAQAGRRGVRGERVGQRPERRRRPTASRRFASRAPISPESTSPVPAVASAGGRPGLTATSPLGQRDERVVALEQHHRAAALARPRATLARRVAAISSELRSSRRPSSPSCGVSTVGAAPLAQQLEPARVRVEPVGVDQQRRVDGARHAAGELLRARRRARGRGPAPRRRRAPPSRRPRPRRPACGSRPHPAGRGSSAPAGAGRPPAAPAPAPRPGRIRRRRAAPSGPPASARRSARASRRPRRPRPRRTCCRCAPRRGYRSSTRSRDQAAALGGGCAARDADLAPSRRAPARSRPGFTQQPELGARGRWP